MNYFKYSLIIFLQLQLLCSCLPIPLKKGSGPVPQQPESSENFLAKFYAKRDCSESSRELPSVNRISESVIANEVSGIFVVEHRLDFSLFMTKNNEATLEYKYGVSYHANDRRYKPSNSTSRIFRKKLHWRYDETTLSFFNEAEDTSFNIIREAGKDANEGPIVNPVKMFDEIPSDLIAKVFKGQTSTRLKWQRGNQILSDESISFDDECDEPHVNRHGDEESYRQELVFQDDCKIPGNAKYIRFTFDANDGHYTDDIALGAINASRLNIEVFLFEDGSAKLKYIYNKYGANRNKQEGSFVDGSWSYQNYQLVIKRDSGTDAELIMNTENQEIIKVINGKEFFSDISFTGYVITDNPLFASQYRIDSKDIESLQTTGAANYCQ